jgi:hypothetical protein
LIRIGHSPHVPLAEADLTPPVRRRVPAEEWKDRTDDDPPIAWDVAVMLSPPDPMAERADLEATVAAAAARADARGWDSEPLDGWLADTRAAMRRAGGGEGGWFTYHSPSFRVHVRIDAPTNRQALAAARERCPAPEGWRVDAYGEPARD